MRGLTQRPSLAPGTFLGSRPSAAGMLRLSADGAPEYERPTLLRASPNPFVTQTAFQFALTKAENASVAVYDISGRLVRNLHRGVLSAGERSMTWDGRNDGGRAVASGTYFLRVQTPTQELSSKLFRLR